MLNPSPALDWLAQRAQISPHKLALIHGQERWSYRALHGLVDKLAGQLLAAGVEPGQRVAVLLPNRAATVGLIHALIRVGATLVPLNLRLTASELKWQVSQAECRLLICDQATEAQATALGQAAPPLFSLDPPQSDLVQPLSQPNLSAPTAPRPLDLTATQAIIFTSGTTGQPKGAMLSLSNHLWSATASAFRLGTQPEDRWLACLPLYHVGGLAIVLRCCLYGAAVILQPGFDPAAVLEALARQRPTLISLVPTMLHRLLDLAPDELASSTLRVILVGGAAAPASLLERAETLGLPLAPTYGLTEAASQVATAGPDEGAGPPGRVGKPLMFSQVKIVDEQGRSLPPGQTGEIVVRGPTVMQGYYRQPAATRQALRQGALHTGDLGYLDEAGYLWLRQRRSDLIVSGGENVYPAEVEAVLRRHPQVADVCVVGLPDEEWGQRVAALVVLRRPDSNLKAAELEALCRSLLAGYKIPRLIRFAETLPRTASGKVQREAVRRWLAAG